MVADVDNGHECAAYGAGGGAPPRLAASAQKRSIPHRRDTDDRTLAATRPGLLSAAGMLRCEETLD
jgi:hypothetical protein